MSENAINAYFWWTGLAANAVGAVGVVAGILIWSLNIFFKLTGFTKVFLLLYRDHLEAKRIRG